MFAADAIEKLEMARIRYYQPDLSAKEREAVTNEIIGLLDNAFPGFSFQITGKRVPGQNKELIRHWFTHATIAAPFFNMDFFYPELKGKGFDCVIGNPPYGGTKVSDEVRTKLDIESKDPYGAFIARFLSSGQKETPLKHGGVLAFIVSDTFMTIKSHYKLRRQMMDNYIHKMIRVHPDTFRATVNTAIIICERNVFPKKDNQSVFTFDDNHVCQMVDMTNISLLDDHSRFNELLHKTEGVDFSTENGIPKSESNEVYAIYYYPQSLIRTNSNQPFFVASPKLFSLMNDDGKEKSFEEIVIGKQRLNVRKIILNSKHLEIFKLGQIAQINQGISTGQNSFYLRRLIPSNSYRIAKEEQLLTEDEVLSLTEEEKLFGIRKNKFNGRHLIKFDKGSDSNSSDGWMPNYFVDTDFCIDWSAEALKRMRTLTIAQRKIEDGEQNQINRDDDKKIASALRNQDKWFKPTINFSPTGQYSPTFRLGYGTVSQNTSSTIVISNFYQKLALGILSSKLAKCIFKNLQNHTVHTQEGDVVEFPMVDIKGKDLLEKLIFKIIQKQKSDFKYDYASHEQIEIDKLVYKAYGLNADDVMEVENWYARRYPKLSKAQKSNLLKLGKSDDYLVLYGLK